MNWVGPNAPAHEPMKRSGGMSPRCRISSAARNSPRKYSRRRPTQASVAVERSTGRSPLREPKFRLHAPDRRDDRAVDPIGARDRGECRRVLRQQLLAVGNAFVADQQVEIIPGRPVEFRLRIEFVHDAQIGRETRGKSLVTGPRDAAPLGVRPQAGKAIAELGCGRADGVGSHARIAGRAGLSAPLRCCVGRRRNRGGGRGLNKMGEPIGRTVLRMGRMTEDCGSGNGHRKTEDGKTRGLAWRGPWQAVSAFFAGDARFEVWRRPLNTRFVQPRREFCVTFAAHSHCGKAMRLMLSQSILDGRRLRFLLAPAFRREFGQAAAEDLADIFVI